MFQREVTPGLVSWEVDDSGRPHQVEVRVYHDSAHPPGNLCLKFSPGYLKELAAAGAKHARVEGGVDLPESGCSLVLLSWHKKKVKYSLQLSNAGRIVIRLGTDNPFEIRPDLYACKVVYEKEHIIMLEISTK